MKKFSSKKVLYCFALVAVVFICTACPAVTPLKPNNENLKGKWSNNLSGDDGKTFEVFDDYTFTCRINPGPKDADQNPNYQGWGTAEGQLDTIDEDIYQMYNLTGSGESPTTTWHTQLFAFNGENLHIEFVDTDTFKFESANNDNPLVTEFFGGTYYRIP